MIDFDNQLLDSVNTLTAEIDAVKTQFMSGDYSNVKDKIQAMADKLELLEDTFDKRKEVIIGVTQ